MPRALHGDEWHLLNPLSPDTVSQLVIPAKSRKAGREPGSRKSMNIPNFHWIPDLAALGGLVRNDGFGELWLSLQGGGEIFWKILEAPTFGRGASLLIKFAFRCIEIKQYLEKQYFANLILIQTIRFCNKLENDRTDHLRKHREACFCRIETLKIVRLAFGANEFRSLAKMFNSANVTIWYGYGKFSETSKTSHL